MSRRDRVSRALWPLGAAVALALGVQAQAALDLDALVAAWLFDEADGEEVSDASGNGNDGEFVNDVQWVKGKVGGALEFEGTGWVEMNNPVVTEAEEFTMGCWVKPADEQKKSWTNILSSHQEPPQVGMSIEQDVLNTNLYYLIAGDGAVWMGWVKGNLKTQLEADEWQHFVAVREGTTLTHYLDGEEVGDSNVGDETLKPAITNFRLGNWILNGREWVGLLDEAFIFNRALDEKEIGDIVRNGFAGDLGVSPDGKAATAWATLKAEY